jgi:hypothetical protein
VIVVMPRMIVVMIMIMMVVMIMRMTVRMIVVVIMVIIVMMQALARPRAARVFVKYQGFDGDRNRVGRHADAAEIDIVEIP